jgi:hypothetical protein
MNEEKSEAARTLGKIKTEKKSASSRKSLEIAREKRWTQVKACTCGTTTDKHKSNCPVYMRLAQQNIRSKK